MAKQLKGLITIVTVVMLVYLVSSADTLVAGGAENEAGDRFADATISVEASLVAVEFEALEEIVGESDIETLGAIPLENVMRCIREDEGEVISIVKLAVRNGSSGEMNKRENVEEERKNSGDEVSEQKKREDNVSFRVVATIIDINRISVSFDFKQIALEGSSLSESESEEQEEEAIEIEISSEVVLRAGQQRIVSATKREAAIFLIMGVDI
jgi:hypothetical protein